MDIWGCNVRWIWQTNQIFQYDDQFLTSFARSLKKHMVLHYPDERLCVFFCWLILDALCQVLLSVGLIGRSICWNKLFSVLEETHNRGLPSNPNIYTTSHSVGENWPLVRLAIVHFICPVISSIPQSCTVPLFIACHNLFITLKRIAGEYGQGGFFA